MHPDSRDIASLLLVIALAFGVPLVICWVVSLKTKAMEKQSAGKVNE